MQIATQIAYKIKQTIGQTNKKRMCVCEPMRDHNKTVNWTNEKQNKLRCLIKWNIYCIFRFFFAIGSDFGSFSESNDLAIFLFLFLFLVSLFVHSGAQKFHSINT